MANTVSQFKTISRADLLKQTAVGFGSMALAALLGEKAHAAMPTAQKGLDHAAKAKRVIFLFMHGGPSHVDTFDYKPMLQKSNGQSYNYQGFRFDQSDKQVGKLLASPWGFKQYGKSGQWVSELFPEQAKWVDDICFLKGMHTVGVAHGPATLFMHTGSTNLVRPSMGSWVSYGLGSENKNLPSFITLHPPLFMGGQRNYGSAFLPSVHQGTAIGHAGQSATEATIRYLKDNARTSSEQERQRQLLFQINAMQSDGTQQRGELDTAIQSFEMAARMQSEAPDILDISKESEATKEMYGLNQAETQQYGAMCLKARRLSEAGVRFVQVNYSENHNNPRWDQHSNLKSGHEQQAKAVDKPIAALIQDLKQRGLLEDTLIVWSGEFGRTPFSTGSGRDHNPFGFTSYLIGAGVKGGFSYGETDEVGFRSVKDRVFTHDLHATILHLMGLDHESLTYRYAGRDFRLTDVEGHVVREILA